MPERHHKPGVDDYVQGILTHDRVMLARAITLIESNAPQHMEMAQDVLQQILPYSGNSIRVGITGVPGAGKSTLIEALGLHLIEQGHKVAVLAVDPSSTVTGGSILGDKTRMEQLSRNKNAYIRPSPTTGILGGVARKSRETILLCEAAGFDVILVETVGTGQSEVTVRSMVDFFLLVLITGAGDELQGIKKGVVELADAIVINKADGANKIPAQAARAEYNRALHYLTPASAGWHPRAYDVSAITGENIPELWTVIERFKTMMTENGTFENRRREQLRDWLHSLLEEQLLRQFYAQPHIQAQLPDLEKAVMAGERPVMRAVQDLLK